MRFRLYTGCSINISWFLPPRKYNQYFLTCNQPEEYYFIFYNIILLICFLRIDLEFFKKNNVILKTWKIYFQTRSVIFVNFQKSFYMFIRFQSTRYSSREVCLTHEHTHIYYSSSSCCFRAHFMSTKKLFANKLVEGLGTIFG